MSSHSASLPFTATRPPPLDASSWPVSLSFPLPPNTPAEHRDDVLGRIAVITLSNVEKLNAVRFDDVLNLVETLRWLAEQPKVTVVILTGRGRFFSAGAMVSDKSRDPGIPLEAYTSRKPEDESRIQQYYVSRIALGNGRLSRELANFPKVLVGAMNGPAVGIMAAVVGHCDLIYSYDNFWLSVPFTTLGLVSEGLASQTFVAKLGMGRAQEALLEGKRMDAQTLAQTGFITRLFASDSQASSNQQNTSDKAYTVPILDEVLKHVGDKLMPPTADAHALLHSKQLIQRVTYDKLSREEALQVELRGAEDVFTSGVPLARFARIAAGGRHKL
ncbi:unnamed protein product [Parajaminaea phylloscopi]